MLLLPKYLIGILQFWRVFVSDLDIVVMMEEEQSWGGPLQGDGRQGGAWERGAKEEGGLAGELGEWIWVGSVGREGSQMVVSKACSQCLIGVKLCGSWGSGCRIGGVCWGEEGN